MVTAIVLIKTHLVEQSVVGFDKNNSGHHGAVLVVLCSRVGRSMGRMLPVLGPGNAACGGAYAGTAPHGVSGAATATGAERGTAASCLLTGSGNGFRLNP